MTININKLVAEKVMLWGTPTRYAEALFTYSNGRVVSIGSDVYEVTQCGNRRRVTWSPSVNILDAFEVVERMHQLGAVVSIISYPPASKWRTRRIVNTDNTPEEYTADADTAAMAICLAALAAVGEEIA